jgi:hypothetical protein
MEAGFSPATQVAGLVASLCARGAGFDAAVSNPRLPLAQGQATRKGLAGTTSRPVEFLFRSATSDSDMAESKKTGREFRSHIYRSFFMR